MDDIINEIGEEIEDFRIESEKSKLPKDLQWVQKSELQMIKDFESNLGLQKDLIDVLDGNREPEKVQYYVNRMTDMYASHFSDIYPDFLDFEKSALKYKLRQTVKGYLISKHKFRIKSDTKKIDIRLPSPISVRFDNILSMMKTKLSTINMLSEIIYDNYQEILGDYLSLQYYNKIWTTFITELGEKAVNISFKTSGIRDRLRFDRNRKRVLSDIVDSEIVCSSIKENLICKIDSDKRVLLYEVSEHLNNSLDDTLTLAVLYFIANTHDGDSTFFFLINDKQREIARNEINKIQEGLNKEARDIKEMITGEFQRHYSEEDFPLTKRMYNECFKECTSIEGILPEKTQEEIEFENALIKIKEIQEARDRENEARDKEISKILESLKKKGR